MIARLDAEKLAALKVQPLTKGMPFDVPELRLDEIGAQGWNLLAGDLPLPIAVVREQVLHSNSAWMSQFTGLNGLVIAPHGKTTMSPQLFDLQIADGAWAITVATVQQLQVCITFGLRRVLLANQLIGRAEIDFCLRALQDPGLEIYCLLDSPAGLAALAESAKRLPSPTGNPLRILIEVGFAGGRAGSRSRDDALALARAVAGTPGLELAGFECFEGLLPSVDAAQGLIDDVTALAQAAMNENLYTQRRPVVITAGGTAFFDRVGERFNAVAFDRPVIKVLRSGCYLTHDSTVYAQAFEAILARTALNLPPGGLKPALEVWAHVQSRPEPGRAILAMGKRDAGFDAGLPVPLHWYRPGAGQEAPLPIPAEHRLVAMNDQHAHMELPETSPLAPGDMVGFGIGHPCTTFDKWQLLMLVDESYAVTGALKTFF